eukprot:XP_002517686.2 uncharacterized protein LOC8282706 [Ricinus communis]
MFSLSFNSAVSGVMEPQRSSKAGAESLNVLQKLQEIFHHKEIKIALLKLGIYSSEQNLSVVNPKSNASSSKLKRIDELEIVDEIPEDFTPPDGMKEEDQREMHRAMNGRKLLTDSRASNSTEVVKLPLANSSSGKKGYVNSRNGKQVMQSSEIEQLSERLKFLEEESKLMKQEFLEQVEERKQLVNEIYQHFRAIYHCLQLEDPESGERCFDETYILYPREEGGLGTGLSEVLRQDSSSYVITGEDQRTNIMALKEAPEE